jgi:Tol biopolymer transport system component
VTPRKSLLIVVVCTAAIAGIGFIAGYGVPQSSPGISVRPGANGEIAFVQVNINGLFRSDRIMVVEPYGSGMHALTAGTLSFEDVAWSPDGSQLAAAGQVFQDGGDPRSGIYVMNPEGTNLRRLTVCSSPCVRDYAPAWSPDGSKIAFQRDGKIYVMDANGADVHVLFACPPTICPVGAPVWSPDGRELAFFPCCQLGIAPPEPTGPYVVNADGSHVRRLLPDAACPKGCYGVGEVAWSPDGLLIAFSRSDRGFNNIYVMNADGTNIRRLTECSALPCELDWSPTWSPDGKDIAFIHDEGQPGSAYGLVEVMKADGSDVRVIAEGAGFNICCLTWQRITGTEASSP